MEFSDEERTILARLVSEHPIMRCQVNSNVVLAAKERAWRSITALFNYVGNTPIRRDINALKRAWLEMTAPPADSDEWDRLNNNGPNAQIDPPPDPMLNNGNVDYNHNHTTEYNASRRRQLAIQMTLHTLRRELRVLQNQIENIRTTVEAFQNQLGMNQPSDAAEQPE